MSIRCYLEHLTVIFCFVLGFFFHFIQKIETKRSPVLQMPRIEANCKNNKLIYPSMTGIQVLEPSLLPPRVDISREKKIRTEAGFESVQTSVEHGHPKQHPNHCTACPSLTCDSCYCLYRLLLLWLLIVIFSPQQMTTSLSLLLLVI